MVYKKIIEIIVWCCFE